MDYETMEIILSAIDRLAYYEGEEQFYEGELIIDEKGIKALKAIIKGLVKDYGEE